MAKLTPETRDAVRDGALASARAVMPLILAHLGYPDGLLDVGAGEGPWMIAYRELGGQTCCGLDIEERLPGAPGTNEHGWPWVGAWDAEQTEPLPLRAGPGETPEQTGYSRWPVALCLETAEHVSPEAGARLVAELCRVSAAVVWSAAIPGQGGDGHVNEQWPTYWQDTFWLHGWSLTDPFRETLWSLPNVEPWYAQNTLLAQPLAAIPAGRFQVRHLVHPTVFEQKVAHAAWWRETALQEAETNRATLAAIRRGEEPA